MHACIITITMLNSRFCKNIIIIIHILCTYMTLCCILIFTLYIDLHSVTEQSFTPEPITAQIQAIHDVRSWLIPHIEDLHGHSQPHCFRFTLNKEGIAEMHFKTWNTDKAWSKEGLLLLKVMIIIPT